MLRVLQSLHERPVITLNEVSRRTGLSFPTSAKGMKALVDVGLARELTGNRRNRVLAYDGYLTALDNAIRLLDEPSFVSNRREMLETGRVESGKSNG